MRVCYIRVNEEGEEEQVFHGDFDSKELAHEAAVALGDSLVGNANALEVIRGFPISETTAESRVSYSIPPTDRERNSGI